MLQLFVGRHSQSCANYLCAVQNFLFEFKSLLLWKMLSWSFPHIFHAFELFYCLFLICLKSLDFLIFLIFHECVCLARICEQFCSNIFNSNMSEVRIAFAWSNHPDYSIHSTEVLFPPLHLILVLTLLLFWFEPCRALAQLGLDGNFLNNLGWFIIECSNS